VISAQRSGDYGVQTGQNVISQISFCFKIQKCTFVLCLIFKDLCTFCHLFMFQGAWLVLSEIVAFLPKFDTSFMLQYWQNGITSSGMAQPLCSLLCNVF